MLDRAGNYDPEPHGRSGLATLHGGNLEDDRAEACFELNDSAWRLGRDERVDAQGRRVGAAHGLLRERHRALETGGLGILVGIGRREQEELARFGSQAWTAQNRFLFQDIVAALRAGESNSEALTAERDAALARVKVLEEDSRDRSRQSNGSSGRVV